MTRVRNSVRMYREARGLTIVQLADDTDLSPTTVGRIDRQALVPSGRVMLRLADYFGVPIQELFWSEPVQDLSNPVEVVAS